MAAKSLSVCMLFGLVTLINAQTQQEKQCDESIYAVTDFDAAAYLGRWYEHARSFAAFEIGGKCITADYSLNYNGTVNVLNTQLNTTSNSISTIEGTASFVGSPTEAKLIVEFPSTSGPPGNYWVLGTDYTSYAAIYGCSNVGDSSYIIIWILVRASSPSEEAVNSALAVFEKFDIDTSLLTKTDQTDCRYTSQ